MSIDDINSKIDNKTKDIVKPIKENEFISNKIEPIVKSTAPQDNKKPEVSSSIGSGFIFKPTTLEPPKSVVNAPPVSFSFQSSVNDFISSAKDKKDAPVSTGFGSFTAPNSFTINSSPIVNIGGFGSAPTSNTNTNTSTNGGGDNDDEGEPILEPEKVLKNKDDTDIILHDVPCKLYRFDSKYQDCDKEGNVIGPIKPQWIDRGKGNFRVTKDATTFKHRMVIRDAIGKIKFNASFYKNMKFNIQQNKSIKFLALVDASKGMENFMIKLKEKDVDITHKILLKSLSELK
jgi:hypothetical protein